MTLMTDLSLTTRRTIAAPAMRIYQAWLDPAFAGRFLTASADRPALKVEIDARVGGRFLIVMPSGADEVPHSGEYLELVPGRKIVFTWNSRHVNPGTTVTVTFEERDGITEVVLTHEKFAEERSRDGHRKGWDLILDNLVREIA